MLYFFKVFDKSDFTFPKKLNQISLIIAVHRLAMELIGPDKENFQ